MSDSGRQSGECRHGRERAGCPTCCDPEMRAYRVRPLVWQPWAFGEYADTLFGQVTVKEGWWRVGNRHSDPCGSVEDGKRQAEAWYRERLIVEALDPWEVKSC